MVDLWRFDLSTGKGKVWRHAWGPRDPVRPDFGKKWHWAVDFYSKTGTWNCSHLGFKSKKEAQVYARKRRKEFSPGRVSEN